MIAHAPTALFFVAWQPAMVQGAAIDGDWQGLAVQIKVSGRGRGRQKHGPKIQANRGHWLAPESLD